MKKRILLSVFFCGSLIAGYGQTDTIPTLKITAEMDSIYAEWIEDLYAFGVERTSDSIILNKDAQRILEDSSYRELLYPDFYLLPVAKTLINKRALKQAFWYLINIYAADNKNKDVVLNIIIPFDQLIEMDKALIASYYTYISFDPQVYTNTSDGEQPREVSRPDIAEQKLLATKEIVDHVIYYRAKQAED